MAAADNTWCPHGKGTDLPASCGRHSLLAPPLTSVVNRSPSACEVDTGCTTAPHLSNCLIQK